MLAAAGLICVLALPERASFLAFWLPVGTLIGIGMGAITTGTSSAAALSVPADRFAAAAGLNQTARQVGGALGIAALAAVLDESTGSGTDPYVGVYAMCTAAAVGVGLTAFWLGPEEAPRPTDVHPPRDQEDR